MEATAKLSDQNKEIEAFTKKNKHDKIELKSLLSKSKKECDSLRTTNKKLDGDVRRLMETVNKKNVPENVTKKEKIILESLSARVNELEGLRLYYEDRFDQYERIEKALQLSETPEDVKKS